MAIKNDLTMNKTVYKALLPITLLGAFSLTMVSSAQDKSIKDGIYTAAQAESGKEIYDRICAGCHNQRFYEQAWPGWATRTVEQFWFYIVSDMPQDNPGSLYDDEYTDVAAYIFSLMGYPAGDEPMDPTGAHVDVLIGSPE
jgi:mono/diheme cytochrome c family protein